jgi:hypothetical protein
VKVRISLVVAVVLVALGALSTLNMNTNRLLIFVPRTELQQVWRNTTQGFTMSVTLDVQYLVGSIYPSPSLSLYTKSSDYPHSLLISY